MPNGFKSRTGLNKNKFVCVFFPFFTRVEKNNLLIRKNNIFKRTEDPWNNSSTSNVALSYVWQKQKQSNRHEISIQSWLEFSYFRHHYHRFVYSCLLAELRCFLWERCKRWQLHCCVRTCGSTYCYKYLCLWFLP